MADSGAPRAGIYIRVSTDEQAEHGYSLAEQRRGNDAYIESRGWRCAEAYEDAGYSGKTLDRPAMNRLRADLAGGTFKRVVVSALDRLSRKTADVLRLIDEFDEAGVTLVSRRESLDTSTSAGRMALTILAAVAENERENILDRTRSGIRGRVAEGKPWGSDPAYGYEWGENGHWRINTAEAEVVRRIMREYVAEGGTLHGIARRLDAGGVPSRRGGKWAGPTLRKIIQGRAILGEFSYGDKWHRGQHEAIVSEQEWLAAQVVAERGQKYSVRGAGRIANGHLFAKGMPRCSDCGSAMLPRKRRDHQDTYVCAKRKQGGVGACAMPVLRRSDVDGRAFAELVEWRIDFDATFAGAVERVGKRAAEVDGYIADAERSLSKAREARERVERDYTGGGLALERYQRLAPGLEEQEHAAQAQRDRLATHRAQLDTEALGEEAFVQRFRDLADTLGGDVREAAGSGDVAKLRACVDQLFSEVVAGVDPHGYTPTRRLRNGGRSGVGGRIRWEMQTEGATPVWLDFRLRPDVLAQSDVDADGPRVALALGENQSTNVAPLRRSHARSSR
jgi:site-specific DNA recombinase